MPRHVDVDLRHRRIFDAVFRLIVSGGAEQASLRKVAAEANLNIGAVRNYFASHEDLMQAAAREIVSRVSERLLRHVADVETGADPAVATRAMLSELLPLDEARRQETAVVFTFMMQGRFTPMYASLAAEIASGTRRLIRKILTSAGIDRVQTETERLLAVVDGLAFHGITDPEPLLPQEQLAVLDLHIAQLRAARSTST